MNDPIAQPSALIPGNDPHERYANALKAAGGTAAPAPDFRVGPPTTPATQSRIAQLEAMRLPPPSAPANNVGDFDRDMQAAGIQRHDAPSGEPDARLLAQINEVFGMLTPEQRDAKRHIYEADLASAYAGRRFGESATDFQARRSAPAAAAPTVSPEAAVPPVAPVTDTARYIAAHDYVVDKEGYAPIGRLVPEALSGYKLTAFIKDQSVNVATAIPLLAMARKAGLTQAQVDNYIRRDLQDGGWLPA